MTIESFVQVWHAQPFRAFEIYLADGRKIRVPHADFVSRSPSGRTVIVHGENDHFEVIDLLLVASLKTVNGANGARRKAK